FFFKAQILICQLNQKRNQNKFDFISKKKNSVNLTAEFTMGALLFYENVKSYDRSIYQAFREFNKTSKPTKFLTE
ncbi:hypothetical protein DFH28DRAFT_956174, partial [Melampsora americana]